MLLSDCSEQSGSAGERRQVQHRGDILPLPGFFGMKVMLGTEGAGKSKDIMRI